MTGFFTPPYKLMIMWYCFSTEKSPEYAWKQIVAFEKYKRQVEMFSKAEKEKLKEEDRKK